MPQNLYKSGKSKKPLSAEEIKNLVGAIRALSIKSGTHRKIAEGFNVEKSKMARYLKKIEEAGLDLTTTSDQKLFDFVSDLSNVSTGKTVFINLFHIY